MAYHKNSKRIISIVGIFAASLLLVSGLAFGATIVGSKHDFSASNTMATPFAGVWEVPGPGGFPLIIDEICVFCHTPHGASTNVPGLPGGTWLWNRTNTASNYTFQMYSSSTMSASVSPTPTGVSLMCMSCHDGVTSIGVNLINAPGSGNPTVTPNGIDAPGSMGNVYNGAAFLGWGPNLGENYVGSGSNIINLSNDHPISFDWPSNVPGLRTAPTDSRLRLFGVGSNRVECATCHNVHDPANEPFLVMPNTNSDMCRACHDK